MAALRFLKAGAVESLSGSLRFVQSGAIQGTTDGSLQFRKAGAILGGAKGHLQFRKAGAILNVVVPPTAAASATPNGLLQPLTVVQLNASASAPAGVTIAGYQWSKNTPTAPDVSNPNIANPTVQVGIFTTDTPVTYSVVAKASNGTASAPASVQFTAKAAKFRFKRADGGDAGMVFTHQPGPYVPPPVGTVKLRFSKVGAITAGVTDPPPVVTTATVTGFNTALGANTITQDEMWTRVLTLGGRVTCGRGYYGSSSLPSNGGGYTASLGKEAQLMGTSSDAVARGITSDRRLNICMNIDSYGSGTYTARKNEVIAYALGVPYSQVNRVYMTDHEYNRTWGDTTTDAVLDAYNRAQYEIAWGIYDGLVSRGSIQNGDIPKVGWVVNIAGSGIKNGNFRDRMVPRATADPNVAWNTRGMPPGTLLLSDNYDNPKGAGGARGYATQYGNETGDIKTTIDDFYSAVGRLGYLGVKFGWGFGEVMSPRRVAPRILNSTLGWVDTRDPDLDGSRMAAALKYYWDYAQSMPVKPSLFLWWFQESGTNWNQGLITAGATVWDAWRSNGVLQTAPVGSTSGLTPDSTLFQNWPIDVDGTLPENAVSTTVLASPAP